MTGGEPNPILRAAGTAFPGFLAAFLWWALVLALGIAWAGIAPGASGAVVDGLGLGRGWGVAATIAVQAAPLVALGLGGRRCVGYIAARAARLALPPGGERDGETGAE